jgi:hypothetical protein
MQKKMIVTYNIVNEEDEDGVSKLWGFTARRCGFI